MEQVPRERFVPPEVRHRAYEDLPLGIGEGQTVSQPYIVSLMLEALRLRGDETVLEVGAGSGYQAAVLSLLVPTGRVVAVELLPSLVRQARERLEELGYGNVTVAQAGPRLGCPDLGPFDAIIVAAASPKLPEALLSQLAAGGRMIIPVGSLDKQELVQAVRTDEGLSLRMMGSCRFVPLIGREAFPKYR
jgi:protein-L-isoaspartate(D-aspartate) O-methyltransferase